MSFSLFLLGKPSLKKMLLYKLYFLILQGLIQYAYGYCGTTLFNGASGTISSPKTYKGGQTCIYKIEQSVFMSYIKLSWNRFEIDGDMPSCNKDYLEVYVGLVSSSTFISSL